MKDKEEPDFAGSAEDELGSDGSSHEDDEKPEDLDEPMDDDEEEIPPPPPPPPAPPAPPVPVEPERPPWCPTQASGDPFEEEDVAVNTRVSDTKSELEADADQPKARRHLVVGCPRNPAPRAWPSLPVHPRSPREAVRKKGKEGAGPRILLPARKRLPGFVFGLAVPELLRPHHGMPLVPWAAVAAMTRVMMMTGNGNSLRACLAPLVRLMSRDPTVMMIGQEQHTGRATAVAVLRVRAKTEGNTDQAKRTRGSWPAPTKG